MARWQDSRAVHDLLVKETERLKTKYPADTWHLQSSRVEAYTYCGCCGVIGFHYMRPPIPSEDTKDKDWPGIAAAISMSNAMGIYRDAREQERQIRMAQLRPIEETFEVIRTCVKCGHEWGQR